MKNWVGDLLADGADIAFNQIGGRTRIIGDHPFNTPSPSPLFWKEVRWRSLIKYWRGTSPQLWVICCVSCEIDLPDSTKDVRLDVTSSQMSPTAPTSSQSIYYIVSYILDLYVCKIVVHLAIWGIGVSPRWMAHPIHSRTLRPHVQQIPENIGQS